MNEYDHHEEEEEEDEEERAEEADDAIHVNLLMVNEGDIVKS
jgi:hypothetical protein